MNTAATHNFENNVLLILIRSPFGEPDFLKGRISKMKYTKLYEIRGHEIYPDYTLKPYHISSYFQDAVANFFSDYNLASFDLQKENQSWIISNLKIDFCNQMPFWRTKVKISIWQRMIKGLRTLIDFTVEDESGNLVAKGSSSWSIINEETRRPEMLKDKLAEVPIVDEELYPDFKFVRLEPFYGETSALSQTIRSYDIDFNKHLNNVRYLAGAIETIPLEYRENHKIKNLEISFVHEVYYNEKLVGISHRQDNRFFHQLIKEDKQVEVCRMITEWDKI